MKRLRWAGGKSCVASVGVLSAEFGFGFLLDARVVSWVFSWDFKCGGYYDSVPLAIGAYEKFSCLFVFS